MMELLIGIIIGECIALGMLTGAVFARITTKRWES